MKNLVDELHKLDEVEFKVSKDFSKNVMKRIHKEESTSKISKVIPWASLGIAACLALVVVINSNVKLNLFDGTKESADNSINQASVYENETKNIADNDYNQVPTYNYLDNAKEYFTPEADGASNAVNDNVSKENFTQNTFEEIKKGDLSSDSVLLESATTGVANRVKSNKEKITDMKLLIEKANLEVEEIEDGLKVKASKDKVKDVLLEYTDISIETQKEYVIVRCK